LKKLERLAKEYSQLARILKRSDFLALLGATAMNTPHVVKTGKLTSVDSAMSRNITVYFNDVPVVLPLADLDSVLQQINDSPSFGNVREIYARNCYLHGLNLKVPQRAVLDLGANRGMFSILALVALQADVVVRVEPTRLYETAFDMLLKANRCDPQRVARYSRLVSSPSVERRDRERNVSIPTIAQERKISRFNFVKIDIEGGEKDLFSEPEWLANVDTIAMELHHSAGDLSCIPAALTRYGFNFVILDQADQPADIHTGMFLLASSTNALAV